MDAGEFKQHWTEIAVLGVPGGLGGGVRSFVSRPTARHLSWSGRPQPTPPRGTQATGRCAHRHGVVNGEAAGEANGEPGGE